MNCKNCSSPIDSNSEFCSKCGSKQDSQFTPTTEQQTKKRSKLVPTLIGIVVIAAVGTVSFSIVVGFLLFNTNVVFAAVVGVSFFFISKSRRQNWLNILRGLFGS